MLNWYVAKSKPRQERIFITNLGRWDVDTFFPQILRPGKGHRPLEPLFPTYVFCRLDPTHPTWSAIRWAPGLAYFLHVEGQLAHIPDSIIEYLRVRVQRWNEAGPQQRFAVGERLTVVNGPFAGLEAIFRGYVPGRRRCQVLLQVVNGLMAAELPEWDLESKTTILRLEPARA